MAAHHDVSFPFPHGYGVPPVPQEHPIAVPGESQSAFQTIAAIHARNLSDSIAVADIWDRRRLSTIMELLRLRCAPLIGEVAPRCIVRSLQTKVYPGNNSKVLARAMDLLEADDTPLWRRYILTRIALKRLAWLLHQTIPELPAAADFLEIPEHVARIIECHARQQ